MNFLRGGIAFMAGFIGPITVRKLIQDIEDKKYYLPSIQRAFVWETDQIEKLFDSLMRGFPIGSFLFWETPKEAVKKFQFYEFIRDFHKLHPENEIAKFGKNQLAFHSILDGQQRITSLYIGLKGSYSDKMKYKPPGEESSYIQKKLYLNILDKPAQGEDIMYYFKFLTDKEIKEQNGALLELSNRVKELQSKSQRTPDEDKELNDKSIELQNYKTFWFKVGDIMDKPYREFEITKVIQFLGDNGINMAMSTLPLDILSRLSQRINDKETLSAYSEDSTDLDQVVNIFVRVNSGGTVLTPSELLLSFATASLHGLDLERPINARDEIEKFVNNNINDIGGAKNFSFEKDTVLKAMLVLCKEIKDINFKVKNFDKNNMKIIANHWDDLFTAMELAVKLIDSFGLNGSNFASNNSLIPIAHYIYNRGNDGGIISSKKYEEDRNYIRYWFMVATLTRMFGASTDGTLKTLRDNINSKVTEKSKLPAFPLEDMLLLSKMNIGKTKVTKRKLADIIIANILDMQYKNRYLYMAFSAIYPWIDLKLTNQKQLNVDHIFPKSKCQSINVLRSFGITKIDFYQKQCNSIVNLQLLKDSPNKSKNDRYFDEWLEDEFEDNLNGKLNYLKDQCLPTDTNYNFKFDNFENFFNDRKKLLTQRLLETFKKWGVIN